MTAAIDDLNERIRVLRSQCGVSGRMRDSEGAAKARSALDGALIERSIVSRLNRLDAQERTRLADLLAAGVA